MVVSRCPYSVRRGMIDHLRIGSPCHTLHFLFRSVDGCYVSFSRPSHVICDNGIRFAPCGFHLRCPFIPKKLFKGLQESLSDHWVVLHLHAIHGMATAKLLNARDDVISSSHT